MIKEETFAAEWPEQFRKQIQYRKINPPVFEKMVYALLLLERLVQSGLEFIFKGGTSMVLLIKNPDRFSVDIDIMTEESKADIEKSLKYVVSNSRFTGWEEDLRESNVSVPKAHYRLFYKSDINPNAEILLDVLFEKCYYLQTVKVPDRTSRAHVNYTKTRNADFSGGVPAQSMAHINRMYDEGIWWFHDDNIGDFTVSNPIA